MTMANISKAVGVVALGCALLPGLAATPAHAVGSEAGGSSHPPGTRAVLVMDLKATGVDAVEVATITSTLSVLVSKQPGLRVLTSDDVRHIAELAADKAALGCDEATAACIAEIGNAMGAELVLYGDVGKLGDVRLVNLHLFDTRRGAAVSRETAQVASPAELPAVLGAGARSLFAPVSTGSAGSVANVGNVGDVGGVGTDDSAPGVDAATLAQANVAAVAADPWAGWLTNFHFDLGAGTAFPAAVVADLHVEGPLGIFIEGEAGWMPPSYFAAINTFVVGVGGYDDATAALLNEAFASSLVLRAGGGIRPLPLLGLEVFGGYTFARGSGAVDSADALAALAGISAPVLTGIELPIETQLHAFHVGLRYRFVVFEHVSIALDVAYLQAVAGDSRVVDEAIESTSTGQTGGDGGGGGGDGGSGSSALWAATRSHAIEELSDVLDAYLDETYQSYVKTPVVGIVVAYHF